MNFGLFMMPLHPPTRSFADSYDRDMELIVQADKLGYHEAWIGEHITETWENAPVPELLIAQALALTKQIIFATGVTMLPLHHPVDTAHRIAMLDHMARGRFTGASASGPSPPTCTCMESNTTLWTRCGTGARRRWRSSWDCGQPKMAISDLRASTTRCTPRR